ncbi:DUF3301 domain-containing protein [Arenimonas sp.]|uniref:DUF3301 domain-containing protein n=1 Tax=Arenimonas sp. TaxID=1872635 RepID=UPI0035B4B890
MLGTLLASISAMALAVFWFSGRAAAEAATVIGQRACASAGVQWLDQSVHLLAIRPRRGPDGWLGLERVYGFEYSTGGEDRHAGRIVLHGRRLKALAGPVRQAADAGTT